MSTTTEHGTQKIIGFELRNGGENICRIELPIRPEDLTRSSPWRNHTHHTLGGVWIDSFGQAPVDIAIVGTTGWRGDHAATGLEKLIQLHEDFFVKWTSLREERAKNNQDPDVVKLVFIDTIHNWVREVVPGQFQLRRSKSRPLIAQYSIQMTAIQEMNRSAATNSEAVQPWVSASRILSRLSDAIKSNQVVNHMKKLNGAFISFRQNMDEISSILSGTGRQIDALGVLVASPLTGAVNAIGSIARTGIAALNTVSTLQNLPGKIRNDIQAALNGVIETSRELRCLYEAVSRFGLVVPQLRFKVPACDNSAGGRRYSSGSGGGTGSSVLMTVGLSRDGIEIINLYTKSDILDLADDIGNNPAALSIIDRDIEIIVRDITAMTGTLVQVVQSIESGEVSLHEVRTYTIQDGESLADIAQREMGDRSRWQELSAINNGMESDPLPPYQITSSIARDYGSLSVALSESVMSVASGSTAEDRAIDVLKYLALEKFNSADRWQDLTWVLREGELIELQSPWLITDGWITDITTSQLLILQDLPDGQSIADQLLEWGVISSYERQTFNLTGVSSFVAGLGTNQLLQLQSAYREGHLVGSSGEISAAANVIIDSQSSLAESLFRHAAGDIFGAEDRWTDLLWGRDASGAAVSLVEPWLATDEWLAALQSHDRSVALSEISGGRLMKVGDDVVVNPDVQSLYPMAGATIYIPSSNSSNKDILDRSPFGADVAVTDAKGLRQLVVSGGDLAVHEGMMNYTQAITHRLMTKAGELKWHPGYGSAINGYLGEKNNSVAGLMAEWEVRKAAFADPRTMSIDSVKVKFGGDKVHIAAQVTAIDRSVAFIDYEL